MGAVWDPGEDWVKIDPEGVTGIVQVRNCSPLPSVPLVTKHNRKVLKHLNI